MRPAMTLGPRPLHPDTKDWKRRVTANNGWASGHELACVDQLIRGIHNNGLRSKMLSVIPLVAGSIVAATTPIFKDYGSDPWNAVNFVQADLSINGLVGDGSTKYLNTGLVPSTAFASDNDGGITLYNTLADNAATADAVVSEGGGLIMGLLVSYDPGDAYWDCYDGSGGGRITASNASWTGYLSGNRVSATDTKLYRANSTTAHAQLATGASNAGARPGDNVFVFCQNTLGWPVAHCVRRFSFVAFHKGLTSAESALFYQVIQSYRQKLGGGWV
ncbi:MAG: hypothetical protein AB1705_08545 [Verrucomicrobiota bacterium]